MNKLHVAANRGIAVVSETCASYQNVNQVRTCTVHAATLWIEVALNKSFRQRLLRNSAHCTESDNKHRKCDTRATM